MTRMPDWLQENLFERRIVLRRGRYLDAREAREYGLIDEVTA